MSCQTYADMLLKHSGRRPQAPFLHQPSQGTWRTLTFAEVEDQARRIAAGLQEKGYEKGSRIGILSKNCAEWFVLDAAIVMAGMVSVPIYTTANEKTIRYVIEHSEMKALFVGKMDELQAAEAAIDDNMDTISFPYPTMSCKETWDDWLSEYTPIATLAEHAPDDLKSVVYTSGSTGVPKGVMLTFRNLYAAVDDTAQIMETTEDDRVMSYLPLAHITERSVVEGVAFHIGCQIYFVEGLETFIDNVQYARPTAFLSVPRLWLKFQSQVLVKMPDKKLQKLLRIPVIGKLVAKKIRKALGLDQATKFGSGSAPISESVLQWYRRIGIEISEGWGMTEVSGLGCSNSPQTDENIGTIGKPLSRLQMKLSDDKEILIRGDAVFSGYYRDEDATKESFVDGWFRTGDCAEITADGDFKIIGRVKEQFKTAKGKYVAPVPIESLIYNNPSVEQVCVIGIGMAQPIALLVLGEGVTHMSSETRNSLEATLNEVNSTLESHARLAKFIVCKDTWSAENELLTPTLKLKRSALESRFEALVRSAPEQKIIWEQEIA